VEGGETRIGAHAVDMYFVSSILFIFSISQKPTHLLKMANRTRVTFAAHRGGSILIGLSSARIFFWRWRESSSRNHTSRVEREINYGVSSSISQVFSTTALTVGGYVRINRVKPRYNAP